MPVLRLPPAVTSDYTVDGWAEYKKWLDGTYGTLPFIYSTESDSYTIAAVDGVFYRTCSIAKPGTDATDFETNFIPIANKATGGSAVADGAISRIAVEASAIRRKTYSVEAALAGANNKDMLCIFNPVGSGKVLRIYEVWATVPSSSGATVIIPFEMRLTSTLTGGTVVTPKKWDSADDVSAANVRHTPTGLTDGGLWYTWVEQINTAQGSTSAHTEVVHNGETTTPLKPLTLRPGEGLFLKQIATNTSTFRMGALFTEE